MKPPFTSFSTYSDYSGKPLPTGVSPQRQTLSWLAFCTQPVWLLLLLSLTSLTTLAQTTWTGSTDTDWATATNWNSGNVPTASDDVIIPDVANDPVISAGTAALAHSVEVQSSSSLTIQNTASLTINGSKAIVGATAAFYNLGTVNNSGALVIGNTAPVGIYGLYNTAAFINNPGGTLQIDRSSNTGLFNQGTFTNAASLIIGANAGVGGAGLENTGFFNNNIGSSLQIDRSTNTGLYSYNGTFTNTGSIMIGAKSGVGAFGLYNSATFTNNPGGSLQIDRSTNAGLRNYTGGTFTNSASIIIGANASVVRPSLENFATFTNSGCATLSVFATFHNSSSFSNEGLLTVSTTGTHTNSGFTNNGILVYPHPQGNPIPNVTNNALIARPINMNFGPTATPALQIGESNPFTVGTTWYQDAGLTREAGTYTPNTFTDIGLATCSNTHPVYFSVTAPGNGCVRTVTVPVTLGGPLISPRIDPPTSTLSRERGAITLTASGNGESISYRWDDNSTAAMRAVSSAGTYSVTLTNGAGCTATASATVTGNASTHPDFAALVDLYNATNGPNWAIKTNWLTGTDPCRDRWHGISCGAGGRVTAIYLDNNQLSGTLPSSLSALTNLQNLYLFANQLSGSLPSSWSALTNLQDLKMYSNQLSGSLPSSWSAMTSLQQLYLFGNQLSGSLPESWSALTNLVNLQLNLNQLSGSLPQSWRGLTNLQVLLLQNNRLSGSLPESWSALTNLVNIRLNNNQLSGSLPPSWSTLTNLISIRINNNQLSGCFPPSYSVFCGKTIDFSGNAGLPGGGDFPAFCSSGNGQCSPLAVTLSASSSAVCAGSTVTVSANVSGAVGTPTYQWYKDATPVTAPSWATTASLELSDIQAGNAGSYSVMVTEGGNTVTSSAFSLLVNTAPTASINPATATLTCANPNVTLTASGGTGESLAYRWEDNTTDAIRTVSSAGTYSVTLTNGAGCSAVASMVVSGQSNTAPTITTLTVGADPQAINTAFAFSAQVIDGNSNLTAASIAWGDGTTTTLTPAPGGGTLSANHAYTTAGVYRINLTLTDACGATATQDYEFAVAYDPSAGFVTGSGWIDSPAGAYSVDPTLTGKANFGFVAKYQKGATVPTGNTEFQFHAGNLQFKSTVYDWLTVAGARAQFKGSGTLNGAGDYGFMLTAIDGAVNGGGGTDKFRIKIWKKQDGAVVYDNQRNTADDAALSTAIGGGSIVIHTPNGKNAREASSVEPRELTVQVLGNPVSGQQVEALISGAAGQPLRVSLVSLQGHTLDQQQVEQAQARQRVVLQVGTLPGVYLLQVSTPDQHKTIRVLKAH